MRLFKDVSSNLLFIGLVVFVSTALWSYAFFTKEIKTYKNVVSVIGVATKEVTSDHASWRISLARKSLDRSANLIKLSADEKNIQSYLSSSGFSPEEISTPQISAVVNYKPNPNGYGITDEVASYETRSTFYVTTNKVNKVEEGVNLLRRYGEENNIEMVEDTSEYTYSAFEKEKIPLLQKAIEDAQNRANALVNATKGVSKTSIGKILSAQQGIFQVNSTNDNSVSDYGNFDTSSIQKTIRATVTVEFAAN
ncbi:SIMPL domain-containing protein [Candidatus Roizmanbacteria bacterium]|nr:SIMPL domain-containing protein [Candidatus Roizmanbacteria bacterium]